MLCKHYLTFVCSQVSQVLVSLHLALLTSTAFTEGKIDEGKIIHGTSEFLGTGAGKVFVNKFFTDLEKLRRMQSQAHGNEGELLMRDDYKVFGVLKKHNLL